MNELFKYLSFSDVFILNVLDKERALRMAEHETTLPEEKFIVWIHALLVDAFQDLTWS